jgi:hypothetical protein
MAIEERNGKRYYYRKKREGGRVVSEYVGAGEIADRLYESDLMEREYREFVATSDRQEINQLKAIDKNLSELEREIKRLTEQVLTEKGFYKTRSREWRLKTDAHNNNAK